MDFITEYVDIKFKSRNKAFFPILEELVNLGKKIPREELDYLFHESAIQILIEENIQFDTRINEVFCLTQLHEIFQTARNVKDITRLVKLGLKSAGVIGGVALASLIISKIHKAYREDKYGSCGKFKGQDLAICRLNLIDVYDKTIKDQKKYCKNSSSPDMCSAKLSMLNASLNQEREFWRNKLQEARTNK